MSLSSDSLLLLPSPPVPVTADSLSAAYRLSLLSVISHLHRLETSSKLFILLRSPPLPPAPESSPRSLLRSTQKLFAIIYTLLGLLLTELDVPESYGAKFIDPRIIIIIRDELSPGASTPQDVIPPKVTTGPLVDLSTFALTRRHWNCIFSVDADQGRNFLNAFQSLANQISPPIEGQIHVVACNLSMSQGTSMTASTNTIFLPRPHAVVAVGGTFDHLHAGHKLLLTATALLIQSTSALLPQSRRLIVGLTGDEMLKKKRYAQHLMSWERRRETVIDFLISVLLFKVSDLDDEIEETPFNEPGSEGRAIRTVLKSSLITIECVELTDAYGPTITDESVTALVVSGETRSGGKAVNEKRSDKGWRTLDVFEIDVVNLQKGDAHAATEDYASKISSTSIRKRLAEQAKS